MRPTVPTALALLTLLLAAPAGARPMADIEARIEAAHPGDHIVVSPGRYEGHLVVRKSVVLDGRGEVVLDGGDEGDVVRVEAPDVTLRGFVITGTGKSLDRENAGITVLAPRVTIEDNALRDVLFGIYLKGAPDSVIRHNRIGGKDLPLPRRGDAIRLWECPRSRVEGNVVRRSRDVVLWFSNGLRVAGNTVEYGRYGIHFMYSNDNVIEDNRLAHNSVGAFLMYSQRLTLRRNLFLFNRGPSGFGVGLKDMDGLVAEANVFAGNRIGLQLDNSPGALDVRHRYWHNVFAWNDIGVAFMPSVERNDFWDNTFFDNVEQVAVLGPGELHGNLFTANGRGNFWSDYRGFDLDGDGVGDLPYRAGGAFESLVDREPVLRFFVFSPVQQAVDLAAKAFPLFDAPPKVVDTAPRIEPYWPPLGANVHAGRARGPLLATAAGLLALAAGLLFGVRRVARAAEVGA